MRGRFEGALATTPSPRENPASRTLLRVVAVARAAEHLRVVAALLRRRRRRVRAVVLLHARLHLLVVALVRVARVALLHLRHRRGRLRGGRRVHAVVEGRVLRRLHGRLLGVHLSPLAVAAAEVPGPLLLLLTLPQSSERRSLRTPCRITRLRCSGDARLRLLRGLRERVAVAVHQLDTKR